jgi:hypothetical protein
MSVARIIQDIKRQAEAREGDDAYHLELELRSGRRLTVALVKLHQEYLEADEIDNVAGNDARRTYIPLNAIDQVTPEWL